MRRTSRPSGPRACRTPRRRCASTSLRWACACSSRPSTRLQCIRSCHSTGRRRRPRSPYRPRHRKSSRSSRRRSARMRWAYPSPRSPVRTRPSNRSRSRTRSMSRTLVRVVASHALPIRAAVSAACVGAGRIHWSILEGALPHRADGDHTIAARQWAVHERVAARRGRSAGASASAAAARAIRSAVTPDRDHLSRRQADSSSPGLSASESSRPDRPDGECRSRSVGAVATMVCCSDRT